MARSTSAASLAAAGVGTMALPARMNSVAPSSASSLRICWLTAPWVTDSSSAARL